MERLAPRKKVNEEETRNYVIRGVKRRDRNENVCARPNGLRETLKRRFREGGLDLPERSLSVVGWRRKKAHRAALVATQARVEPT